VLEALVECAGLLLQKVDRTPETYWLLSGVDAADFAPTAWDHEVGLACAVLRRSSRAATLTVEATHDGRVICHAQILLVRA
jgi:3-hydroxymyristoyl/3-hydroxydecanoyl-(acyl carrier protein) dehydratase